MAENAFYFKKRNEKERISREKEDIKKSIDRVSRERELYLSVEIIDRALPTTSHRTALPFRFSGPREDRRKEGKARQGRGEG